jgi:2-phospho-L-lactate guanylyltransferase
VTPWAVLPVKSFAEAKSRLTHLSAAARASLACALFERTLSVLAACPNVAGTLVLTNSAEVAAQARAAEAEVIFDSEPPPLGRIIDAGLRHLSARGVDAALVVMADLPRLHPQAIAGVIADMRRYPVVIAPDRHDQGTNALGLAPPACIATCFGHDDSLHRHIRAAGDRGLTYALHRSDEIALDIDLLADLELAGAAMSGY